MTDERSTHQQARARPVSDLPADAVLARGDDLARRWAIALIGARPLQDISAIPFEELAREAPSLCAQALRALQSDVELDRLTGTGAADARADSAPARQLAAIAGASDPAAAVSAVEALRGVLWEALLEQLREPSTRQIGDIADRLAYVCAAALSVALDAAFADSASASSEDVDGSAIAPGVGEPTGGGEPTVGDFSGGSASGRRAVIVDERSPVSTEPPSWDLPRRPSLGARVAEIEIRDERIETGPAAWIGSIGGQLERFKRDALPFAVLLVEFVHIDRLRRDQLPEELSALAGHMERALAAELGSWSGSLTRERPGRCWLLIPETGHERARELVERLVRAAAAHASEPGAPPEIAIGLAVCPEDGCEAAALAAHADVGLYAARAGVRASAGRLSVTPVDESA